MDTEEISLLLQDLGLTAPEVVVYLALLELGTRPASVIAKKAGLKRGHTYNLLALLTEKGLVQEFIKNEVRHFSSSPPRMLLSILENREEELRERKQRLTGVLPQLEKIRNPLLSQPKVRFYQGIEGIREIYEDTIREPGTEIYAIGDFKYIFPEERSQKLHRWIWDYADRRAERGIWYNGIVNKSSLSDLAYKRRRTEKRRLKVLHNVELPVEINVYHSKVAIMSTFRDMVGLIIEDEPIAETLRSVHQAIWNFLPDYSN